MPVFCRQAINVSCDAGLIVLVSSSTDTQNSISPNFVHTFNIPAIGVVTKIDSPKANVKRSRNFLSYGGINKKKIYEISSVTGEGIDKLVDAIHSYVDIKR